MCLNPVLDMLYLALPRLPGDLGLCSKLGRAGAPGYYSRSIYMLLFGRENIMVGIDTRQYARKALAALLAVTLAVGLCPASPAWADDPGSGEQGGAASPEVTELQLDTPEQVTLDGDEVTEQWFSFTPEESGPYRFYSSDREEGDPYGALYKGEGDEQEFIDSNDDGQGRLNFSIVAELTAGTTYYLSASDSDDDAASYKVNVADSSSLSAWELSGHDVYAYGSATASLARIGLTLSAGGETLDASNYEVEGWYDADGNKLAAAPSEPGAYSVKLQGIGEYSGECSFDFKMYDLYDLASWDSWEASGFYNGNGDIAYESLGLELFYYDADDNKQYLDSENYRFSGWYNYENGEYVKRASAPTSSGTYYVKVVGAGNYTGEKYVEVSVGSISDISYWYGSCSTFYYEGTPSVTYDALNVSVYRWDDDGEKETTLDSSNYEFAGWYVHRDDSGDEYEEPYRELSEAPTEDGTYYVRLDGTGDYNGSLYVEFELASKYDLDNYDMVIEDINSDGSSPVKFSDLQYYITDSEGEKVDLPADAYEFVRWESDDDDEGWSEYSTDENNGPVEEGYYRVVLSGTGSYSGELKGYFSIYNAYDLDFYSAYANNDIYGYGPTASLSDLDIELYYYDDNDEKVVLDPSLYKFARIEVYGDDGWETYSEDQGATLSSGAYRVVFVPSEKASGQYTGEAYLRFDVADLYSLESWSSHCLETSVSKGDSLKYSDIAKSISLYYDAWLTGEKVPFKAEDAASAYSFAGWYYDDDESEESDLISDDPDNGPSKPGSYLVKLKGNDPYSGELYVSVDLDYAPAKEDADRIAADKAAALISAIGDVTLDSEGAIQKARAAYDALSADQQKLVKNYKVLEAAEAELAPLLDQAAADAVVKQINAIGTVTTDSKAAIEKARAAYNALTDSQKKLVSAEALATLTNAETKLAELEKAQQPTDETLKAGSKFTVAKLNYKVTDSAGKAVAFTGSKAKKISIPATVTYKGVTYKVTFIAAKALKGSKATKVTIGSNVTSIGAQAFQNAKKLTSLTVGKNVKKVGKNALKGCAKLKTVTVKSGKLSKSSAKALVKGSKVKNVKLSGKDAKKMKAKYTKYLKSSKVKVK